MTVEIELSEGDEGTLEHEVGHANDARTNADQLFKDGEAAKKKKGGPNEVAHDDQPQEKRANAWKKKVEDERKAHKERMKQEEKRRKEEERRRREEEKRRREEERKRKLNQSTSTQTAS